MRQKAPAFLKLDSITMLMMHFIMFNIVPDTLLILYIVIDL